MRICLWAIIVILGISIIGCKTDETDNDWEPIYLASVNDMQGIWESTFTVNIPATGSYNEYFAIVFGVSIPSTKVLYENYKIKYVENSSFISFETKMVFDQLLSDTIKVHPEHTKDSLWDNLITFYDPIKDYLNITIEKYCTTTIDNGNVNEVDFSAFFLHKNGKQLKVIPFSQTYKQAVIFRKIPSYD